MRVRGRRRPEHAPHTAAAAESATQWCARAQAYAISVRGRGAARDVGAQHVFFPLLGRLRRGRRCWQRVPGLVRADLAAEMIPGARFPTPSIARTRPFDWRLLISCSRAQARGGRPLLLIGSQGCQSGPFSSLIGLLKKEVGLSLQRLARAGFGGNVLLHPVSSSFSAGRSLVTRGDGKVAGSVTSFTLLRTLTALNSTITATAHKGTHQLTDVPGLSDLVVPPRTPSTFPTHTILNLVGLEGTVFM